MVSVEMLWTALGDLAAALASVTEDEGFEPSGCRGWSVLDLAFQGSAAERFPLLG